MKIFILDDNTNTFDSVIHALNSTFGYPYLQCMSIATLVHETGKCLVKQGSDVDQMTEYKMLLEKNGLNVHVE